MTMTGAVGMAAPGETAARRTEQAAEAIGVRIFGPLTVIRDGRAVALRPGRERRLLALLALRPGRTVGHEEITHTLWGGTPPEAARTLIHPYAARLRGMLGERVVVADPDGYRLVLGTGQLDLREFEVLSRQAETELARRPEVACGLFVRALSIARGPVLADLGDTFAAHPALLAVTRRRVTLALAHADCAAKLGWSTQAVPFLKALLAAEPLHEALAARLMTALAASGQRDAAFDLYAGLRARLRDELGVDPGREVTTARALILQADRRNSARSPRPRRRAPAQLPPSVAGFVGRAEALGELDRSLLPGPADGGGGGLAVLSGAGGSGKTELVVRWARRSAAQFPDGQLFLDLQGGGHLRPVTRSAALSRLLRALGVPGDGIPGGLDEAAALFQAEIIDRRLLIVLDNARDAAQIRPLIPQTAGSAVLVTSRDPLAGLDFGKDVARIAVGELSLDESLALLARLSGSTCTPVQARQLARACGCLPLALRIAAAQLDGRAPAFVESYLESVETDVWSRALVVPSGADSSVRSAFRLSYDALSWPEQELFRLLGLVPGADFGAGAAAALAGIGLEEAEQRLGRLAAAQLVISRRGDGRYALHPLLQGYAKRLAVAAGPVDAPVHRLAAWYLAAVRAAGQAAYPRALRLPDEPAVPVRGSFADADSARTWLDAEQPNILPVIEQAAGQGAADEAWRLAFVYRPHLMARWLARPMFDAGSTALGAARAVRSGIGEAASRITLAVAAETMGDLAAAAEHLHRGAELSEQLGWTDAQAVVLNNLGSLEIQGGRLDEAASTFHHNMTVMRAAGNKDAEALAVTNLGMLHVMSGRLREGVEQLREALRMRASIGPRSAMAGLHTGLGAAYRDLGACGRARQELFDAVRIGRETGERYFACVAEATLVGVACDLGEFAEARERLNHTWDLVENVGLAKLTALTSLHTGWFELVRGRAAAARPWYDLVLSYGESAGDPWYCARGLIGIAGCRRAAEQPGPAVRAGVRALRYAQRSGHRLQIAEAHLELARTHAAFGGRVRALAHVRIGAEVARDCAFQAGIRTAEQVLSELG